MSKHQSAGLLKKFRFHSVFFRFVMLLSVFVLLMTFLFGLLLFRVVAENYSQNSEASALTVLHQGVLRTDNAVYFLGQQLHTLSNNPEIVNAIIVPDPSRSSRNAAVAATLRDTVENNEFVSLALLYDDTMGTVYASSGVVQPLADSPFRGLVEGIRNDEGSVLLGEDVNRTSLRMHIREGSLYISTGFIYSRQRKNPLATLFFCIELPAFFSFSQDLLGEEAIRFEVFSPGDEPIYSGPAHSLEAGGMTVEAQSDYTGLRYRLSATPPSLLGTRDFMGVFLLYIPIILVVGLLISLLVTSNLYKPIEDLVVHFSGGGQAALPLAGEAFSEADYLKESFNLALRDKESLQAMIQNVRPELEQKVFSDLLGDMAPDDEMLRRTFAEVGSAFRLEGNYQLFLASPLDLEEGNELMLYFYLRTMQDTMGRAFRPEWGCCAFVAHQRSAVLVAQYAEGLSETQIKGFGAVFLRQVRSGDGGGVRSLFAGSPLFRHIRQLPAVCGETRGQLRYLIYFTSDQGEEDGGLHPGDNEAYGAQLRQISHLLGRGDVAGLDSLLQQLIGHISEDCGDEGALVFWYERILNTLTLKMLDYHIDVSPIGPRAAEAFAGAMGQAAPRQALRGAMEGLVAHCLERISEQASTRQDKIVASAKGYIESNYANGDLSIAMIANSVGVSPAYLSSMFNRCAGENLVSYLNFYRVAMAKELLRNTTFIIKEVGYQVGFNTVQNFNRVFKRYTGVTPMQYRSGAGRGGEGGEAL